jgi:hypothetical protein
MKTDAELKKLGYKFLGWMNGWGHPYPEEYEFCKNLGHVPNEVSYSDRGYDHTVYCDICKLYWKYDSSD